MISRKSLLSLGGVSASILTAALLAAPAQASPSPNIILRIGLSGRLGSRQGRA